MPIMMLAIAESIEEIGMLLPGSRDKNGALFDKVEARERWDTMSGIAKKYGSLQGIIVTN